MDGNELRVARKSELKRIISDDMAGGRPYEDILKDWSIAADRLIQTTLNAVTKEMESPPKFCVLALGKLGGMELNYSSDVDLLYIYEGDREKATRIANKLNRMLGDITEEGFLFRVDTNLRPDGKDGPIVNTVDSLERYYEIRGREWERQALIRGRPVAGDIELGREFIKRVEPFVFRKSIDISALKRIRTAKMALEKTASEEGWRNIKLGPGGIREAEFIIQALQMLHGGRLGELRTPNTFEALKKLLKHKIINKKRYDELLNAYTLLRRTENMLQAKDDRQIHTLPKHEAELEELAITLGFKNLKSYIIKLDEARRNIQRRFFDLFDTNYEKMEIMEAMEANLATCRSKEEVIDSFAWFKNHISKRIQEHDLAGRLNVDELSERLTFLAETIIAEALKIARRNMLSSYGTARTPDGTAADIAVIGMGRLGAFEMDYGSDLDLVFVYSGDGETDGQRRITNHEYFTKLVQGLLSTIALPTRYGRAYNIDTELRPSGNQGALVSSLEAFERYHNMEAGLWERQALIRARVVAGDIPLGRKLAGLIDDLAYSKALPPDIKEKIRSLREKAVREKAPQKDRVDIKKGAGGIADIETITHCLQLLYGGQTPKLRCKKLSFAMEALCREGFLTKEEYKILSAAYTLFRQILARTRLFITHSTAVIDIGAEYLQAVAVSLGFKDKNELVERSYDLMDEVKKIYRKYLDD